MPVNLVLNNSGFPAPGETTGGSAVLVQECPAVRVPFWAALVLRRHGLQRTSISAE